MLLLLLLEKSCYCFVPCNFWGRQLVCRQTLLCHDDFIVLRVLVDDDETGTQEPTMLSDVANLSPLLFDCYITTSDEIACTLTFSNFSPVFVCVRGVAAGTSSGCSIFTSIHGDFSVIL